MLGIGPICHHFEFVDPSGGPRLRLVLPADELARLVHDIVLHVALLHAEVMLDIDPRRNVLQLFAKGEGLFDIASSAHRH